MCLEMFFIEGTKLIFNFLELPISFFWLFDAWTQWLRTPTPTNLYGYLFLLHWVALNQNCSPSRSLASCSPSSNILHFNYFEEKKDMNTCWTFLQCCCCCCLDGDADVVRLMRQLFPSSFPISISPLRRANERSTVRPPARAAEYPIIMQLLFEKLCLTVLNLSWYLSKSSQPPCAARCRRSRAPYAASHCSPWEI